MNGRVEGKSKNLPMEETPAWLELQEGIWKNILQRLGVEEILKTARKVCSTWNRICKLPSMWLVVNMPNEGEMVYHFEKMCRRAIDHSRGELVDINLQHFADDKLFSTLLKEFESLDLEIPIGMEKELGRGYGGCELGIWVCVSLVEAVQKFPLLEELSLTHTAITVEGIEALGRYCPRLKSFEFNKSLYMGSAGDDSDNEDERNEEALAIAKNLPTLHHLHLIGNSITNKGLQAILDSCLHLVSRLASMQIC
ncbi:putative F-box/LRR-repeat protein 23 [Capsicum annuum]|uniref:putative F-box/LRR-repeat protein 23 n=1 Tax=Capsicum annuum TaxID=4072 RepID=UPI001FB0BACF|nr:putative F-box/LRR-repeat protein 23 [Capsicum annuum]